MFWTALQLDQFSPNFLRNMFKLTFPQMIPENLQIDI
jgi:hypothetical protein